MLQYWCPWEPSSDDRDHTCTFYFTRNQIHTHNVLHQNIKLHVCTDILKIKFQIFQPHIVARQRATEVDEN